MDGARTQTTEGGPEPVSQRPLPAPKPQRFQSARLASNTPKTQDPAPAVENTPEPAITEETDAAPEALEFAESSMLQTEAQVRDCDWEQFKNHYPDARTMYAVEVLLARDDLVEQIEADQLKRVKPDQRKAFEQTRRKSRQARGRKRVENTSIERVRINSAIVLGYLSKVTGEGPWVGKPHTFLAPFNLFFHFHEEMEQELRILEEHFGDASDDASKEPLEESFAFLDNKELEDVMRSRKAYDDMKCFVDFVNARLIPRRKMFAELDSARPLKISYRDLASLFRPGDLVIEPGVSQSESRITNKQNSSAQVVEPKLWRVCYVSEDTPAWSVHNLDSPGGELQGQVEAGDEATHLRLYYLDFDGERFSPVRGDASIDLYEGEKEITKLPVYPLRFHKDHQRFLTTLQERGERFREIVCSGNPTLSYHGWTLTKDPSGRDIVSKPGQNAAWPEYVESHVIVDFNEAFQVYPWWKPSFQQFPEGETFYSATAHDEYRIVEWSDKNRSKELASREEVIVEYDGVRELEWENFTNTDPFLCQEETSETVDPSAQTLSPDDLALLPSRLFVYALRNRAFVNADIRHMKPVSDTLSPLDSLRLPEKYKVIIQSAVAGHLEKKKLRRQATQLNSDLLEQDVIHGKGRGLAILLHGPPGVGKTATAEAIAHFYKKPLFHITSSDLGNDPWDVETKLTEIFRLASLWDCILLLDEAETLVSQREKKESNLQKSSLVAVFLRTLEYFSGILFLTTNRPDVMDDAVKSRVQVSLQYPRLGLIETLAIFQTNIDRLIDIEFERAKITGEPGLEVKSDGILAFAAAHYHRHEGNPASPPWNGRQIRNAFQIAPSIARYGPSGEQDSCIGPEHFEKVEESAVESEPVVDRERGHMLQSPVTQHSSPNRQSAFSRRGMRTSTRFSGEFHLRQRSPSNTGPLYLPSTPHPPEEKQTQQQQPQQHVVPHSHLRQPTPPLTPDAVSVTDAA